VSDIQVVYDAGIREFGENKVQEMNEKQAVLPSDINWHMIGHLQRNKVKNVVGTTKLIHSVDSIRLAEEISREAQKKQCVADILLEVNVAGEETKFGFTPDEALAVAEEVGRLPGLHVKGLMTSAPFVENAEENRKYFRKLRELAVDIRKKNIDNVDMVFLSMGMTNDYAVAVEEGATHVRVALPYLAAVITVYKKVEGAGCLTRFLASLAWLMMIMTMIIMMMRSHMTTRTIIMMMTAKRAQEAESSAIVRRRSQRRTRSLWLHGHLQGRTRSFPWKGAPDVEWRSV
jgi:hypothetical protein